ncbi:MAG: hypothetical protein ACI92S_000616 [Planctomycetaceae bacterium]|jgi:hypothetical protein
MIHLCQQCFGRLSASTVFVIEKPGKTKIYRRSTTLATHARSRLSRQPAVCSVNELRKTRLENRKALG